MHFRAAARDDGRVTEADRLETFHPLESIATQDVARAVVARTNLDGAVGAKILAGIDVDDRTARPARLEPWRREGFPGFVSERAISGAVLDRIVCGERI